MLRRPQIPRCTAQLINSQTKTSSAPRQPAGQPRIDRAKGVWIGTGKRLDQTQAKRIESPSAHIASQYFLNRTQN